jgi:pimeloyl-ACP methyl ester carboxylesterase
MSMSSARLVIAGLIGALAVLPVAYANEHEHKTYGSQLEGFDYPYEVHRFQFTSQGADLSMAYMDVIPQQPNGRTAVLLHGRNFCAATWETSLKVLSGAGYRVIAPDQIGFCKSSKPLDYQFSIQQLATNTNALVKSLGITRATYIGHSFGGMTALRYALMFPDAVEQLVLINPIGLEDWQAKGAPYLEIDKDLVIERQTNFDNVKQYEQRIYYAGQWKPDYDRWVEMLAGMFTGPGGDVVSRVQARVFDMAFTQPVVHEFEHIRSPTTLMIGQLDRTALAANRATPEVAKTLGNYPELGRDAARRIPNSKLIEFPQLGHAPQIQAPDEFHAALLKTLGER